MIATRMTKLSGALALTGLLAFAAGVVAAERFPELNRADHALHDARAHLDHAATDYGGHRVKAIEYVDGALHEIAEAKHFAETH